MSPLIAALLGLAEGPVGAEGTCLEGRVRYQAPAGCPDAQYLCDRLLDRSGGKLALEPGAWVNVRIDAAGGAGSFELGAADEVLATRDFAASSADDCRELVRTIASSLVAALGTVRDEEPAPTATPTPAPTAAPTPTPTAAPTPTPAPAPWTGEWLIGASFSAGWAPAPTWGARLGARLSGSGTFSAGLEARLESTLVSAELRPGVGVDVLLLALSPSLCLQKGAFSACADAVLGALRSTSTGLEGTQAATSFSLAAGLRAGLSEVVFDELRGGLYVEVHAPLVATELLAGEVLLWRSPPLSLGLSLALSGSFF